MKSVLLVLTFLLFATTIQAYGLGCSPSNNNQDCENPKTQTCTKILIGTTAKTKALGKYYYQCLPNEWAAQAVTAAQSHTFGAQVLDVPKVEEHKTEEVKPLEVKQQEVKQQEAKPEAAKTEKAQTETANSEQESTEEEQETEQVLEEGDSLEEDEEEF